MIWRHHYSLIISAVVTTVLVFVRPEPEWWFPIPLSVSWGAGHAIIIKIEKSSEKRKTEALREELKRRRMVDDYERDRAQPWRRDARNDGRKIALGMLGLFVFVFGGAWLGTYGVEGLVEWFPWWGCQC